MNLNDCLRGKMAVMALFPALAIAVACGGDEEVDPVVSDRDRFPVVVEVRDLQGDGLELELNEEEALPVHEAGEHEFELRLLAGEAIDIRVLTQPDNPPQLCTVPDDVVSMQADMEPIAIQCVDDDARAFRVGGALSGLLGQGLVLKLNDGQTVAVGPDDDSFVFPEPVLDSRSYQISVDSAPRGPLQSCDISPSSGVVDGADILDIEVECSTRTFAVGGEIVGLEGSGLIIELSDGQTYSPESGGSFEFSTPLRDQTEFSVAVTQNPVWPDQQCLVEQGEGTIDEAAYHDVTVTCVTDLYAVSGTIHGLVAADQGLTLSLNGESLGEVHGSDGAEAVSFASHFGLPTGAEFAVQVQQNPTGPIQHCAVSNGEGVVGSDPHDQVRVDCQTTHFAVGGSVSGLQGSGMQLSLNNGQVLSVTENGNFVFEQSVPDHSPVEVQLASRPSNPSQTCVVDGDGGTVDGGDYLAVTVDCETDQFTVGGVVENLEGDTVRLTLNANHSIDVVSNGSDERSFVFSDAPLEDGSQFTVAVESGQQPRNPNQECTVESGAEDALNGEDYRDVRVVCATRKYRIEGTLAGLASGNSIGLNLESDTGNEVITRTSNGGFSFSQRVEDHRDWSLSVETAPSGPNQTCEIEPDFGTIAGEDVSNIEVSCETDSYSIGGSVSGLEGGSVELSLASDSGNQSITRTSNGSFSFSQEVHDHVEWEVTITSQPSNPNQICSVEPGSGTVNGADVNNVVVDCENRKYSIGGSISGLESSVELRLTSDDGNQTISRSSNGSFNFGQKVSDHGDWAVSVSSQPSDPNQECTVSPSSGTVNGSNASEISVECTTKTYTVGGSISGLESSVGLRLISDSGNQSITRSSNGSFTFSRRVADHRDWEVRVNSQPEGPSQTCSVSNRSGTIDGSNVSNVSVSCQTNSYSIRGTINSGGTEVRAPEKIEERVSGQVINNPGFDDWVFPSKVKSGQEFEVVATNSASDVQCTVTPDSGEGVVEGQDAELHVSCFHFSTTPVAVDGDALFVDWFAQERRSYSVDVYGDQSEQHVLFSGYLDGMPVLEMRGVEPGGHVVKVTALAKAESDIDFHGDDEEELLYSAGSDGFSTQNDSELSVYTPPASVLPNSAFDDSRSDHTEQVSACVHQLFPEAWEIMGEDYRDWHVSPDGRKALALSKNEGIWQSFEWDADRSQWAELAEDDAADDAARFLVDAFHRQAFVLSEDDEIRLKRIDEDGLPGDTVGKLSELTGVIDFAVDPAGRWLSVIAEDDLIRLYRVNPHEGVVSHVRSWSHAADWVAVRPGGKWLFVGDSQQATLSLYRVDASVPDITIVSTNPMVGDGAKPRFTPDGRFMVFSDAGSDMLLEIDESGMPRVDRAVFRCDDSVSDANFSAK